MCRRGIPPRVYGPVVIGRRAQSSQVGASSKPRLAADFAAIAREPAFQRHVRRAVDRSARCGGPPPRRAPAPGQARRATRRHFGRQFLAGARRRHALADGMVLTTARWPGSGRTSARVPKEKTTSSAVISSPLWKLHARAQLKFDRAVADAAAILVASPGTGLQPLPPVAADQPFPDATKRRRARRHWIARAALRACWSSLTFCTAMVMAAAGRPARWQSAAERAGRRRRPAGSDARSSWALLLGSIGGVAEQVRARVRVPPAPAAWRGNASACVRRAACGCDSALLRVVAHQRRHAPGRRPGCGTGADRCARSKNSGGSAAKWTYLYRSSCTTQQRALIHAEAERAFRAGCSSTSRKSYS